MDTSYLCLIPNVTVVSMSKTKSACRKDFTLIPTGEKITMICFHVNVKGLYFERYMYIVF